MTADQLEMFFNTSRAPNAGGNDIFTARRGTVTDAWSMIGPVTALNTSSDDATPDVSADGLTMFFVAAGTVGQKDVFVATRADRAAAWGGKTQITAVSTPADDSGPTLTADLLTMYLSANPSGDDDIYVATRPMIGAAWSTPALVPGINSATANDGEPCVNATNTLLLWASSRAGSFDLWMARRANASDPWGPPMAVSELNTAAPETDPWLSPDEYTIYFARDAAIYVATR